VEGGVALFGGGIDYGAAFQELFYYFYMAVFGG
jgi:hypothetical protein